MNEQNNKNQARRKFVTSVACLLLLLIMMLGSTVAWFTDTSSTTNTMVAGKIGIDQTTEGWDELVMMPTQTYATKVVVTNTGNQDCYIRTLFAFEDDAEGTVLAELTTVGANIVIPGVNTDKKEDKIQFTATKDGETVLYTVGFYVHEAKVAPEGEINPLTSVKLEGTADNDWTAAVKSEYTLLVLSQATQTTGMGDVAADALNKAFDFVTNTSCATWFALALGSDYAVAPVNP